MKFLGAKKSFTLVELPVMRKRAFTLVELLIVMAIISIIAAFIVVNLASSRARARDTKRVADLEALDSAINRYYREVGHYPDLPDGCGTLGINGAASDVASSIASGDCLAEKGGNVRENYYIKGLVPAYISKLPVDSGPQIRDSSGKVSRGFIYIHSNVNPPQNIECYKIMALNPESPKLAGYKPLWDPARDGGPNNNIVDGTNISAWSKYSRGCAAK